MYVFIPPTSLNQRQPIVRSYIAIVTVTVPLPLSRTQGH